MLAMTIIHQGTFYQLIRFPSPFIGMETGISFRRMNTGKKQAVKSIAESLPTRAKTQAGERYENGCGLTIAVLWSIDHFQLF